MRTLYLDCQMGAAGDMLAAALIELLPDPEGFIAEMNALAIPEVTLSKSAATKCGISGTHFSVTVHGIAEDEALHDHTHDHNHDHEHTHDHNHDHEHTHDHNHDHEHEHTHNHDHGNGSIAQITSIVEALAVSAPVRRDILAVYALLSEAESHVHGVPIADIHFHEVGTMDALADITAVCLLMEKLAVERVVVSPVHVGSGQVRCAHGILPVPAPATAHILRGVPIYGGSIKGELCTPTGAALLKHFASTFGAMPPLCVEAIGYGMGKKDFPAANCVRALLGDDGQRRDDVLELSCNIDDMSGEALGFAMEALFSLGALEVFTTAVGMKKSRPGVLLSVLCAQSDREQIVAAIFRHTTTIGIRETLVSRHTLSRKIESLSTPYGEVRRKISDGYGIRRVKYEHDDLARIARESSISLAEAQVLVAEYFRD